VRSAVLLGSRARGLLYHPCFFVSDRDVRVFFNNVFVPPASLCVLSSDDIFNYPVIPHFPHTAERWGSYLFSVPLLVVQRYIAPLFFFDFNFSTGHFEYCCFSLLSVWPRHKSLTSMTGLSGKPLLGWIKSSPKEGYRDPADFSIFSRPFFPRVFSFPRPACSFRFFFFSVCSVEKVLF